MVDDRLHTGWKLVIDAEERRTRVFDTNVPDEPPQYGVGDDAGSEDTEEEVVIEDEYVSVNDKLLEEDAAHVEDESVVVYRRRRKVVNKHVINAVQEEELRMDDEEVAVVSDGEAEHDEPVQVDEGEDSGDYVVLEL